MTTTKPINNSEHISILLPTRERPEQLKKLLDSLSETTHSKQLIDVWIYVDNDDCVTRDFSKSNIVRRYDFDISWIFGDRTKSQGQMINILWEKCTTNAGIYLPCADDYVFVTRYWDDVVREAFNQYPDRILLAYLEDPTSAPEQVTWAILSAEWINVLGRVLTEYFPFWFDDSWLDQVAQMVKRKVKLPMRMEPQGGKGKTPRMKNILFWWKFFQINTMDERIADADRLRKFIYSNKKEDYEKSKKEGIKLVKHFTDKARMRSKIDLLSMEQMYSDDLLKWNGQMNRCYMEIESNAVNHLNKKANQLYENGQYDSALDSLDNILLSSQERSNVHFLRAKCLKQLGRLANAKKALVIALERQPEDKKTLMLLKEINESSSKNKLSLSKEKGKRTGIIIFGHSRPLSLRNILESLRRQGTTNDIHVWLDGHHGRESLIDPVRKCRELVEKMFPEVHLIAVNGNIGIEKLMIDGLSFMSQRYDRIIVLEDDCFPIAGAIAEFERTLDDIATRPDVYSVYGHPFLTESEGETITRFQGWGWATTREKLLPVLGEIKRCFSMSEPDYLQWVHKNLTPEVISRLDVTPGRNCVPVIASFFCWDGCTCLITAMRGLVHKKTEKRVIYNCGMGGGSTHFQQNDRFRHPPFNMITPEEVWNYYDPAAGQPTSLRNGAKTTLSIGHKTEAPQAREIIIDGVVFTDIKRTEYKNNSVGYNDKYIIKIEHEKHPRKLRSLSEEIEIIKYLNSRECVSCPRIVSEGRLKTGERYFIQERIYGRPGFNKPADMLFPIIEQKNFGVCEGDWKKENFIFGSDSFCYIIDYDQAIIDERLTRMGNIEYLEWFAQYFKNRWNTNFFKFNGYSRDEIFSLFKNDSFNLAATTIFKEQITTNSESGIYHSLNTERVYIEGARDLKPRLSALNTIEFRKGESVLDVGCNMGLIAHYMHDRGCRVTGIDMDRKIVAGAKMVANILNKNIQFKWLDLDIGKIEENYDTIYLFSVIHHVKNFKLVTENIARRCNRIIIECGLKEYGSKPINGKWTNTSGWEFNSLQELTSYLETVFIGFKFQKNHGNVDRNREIITFVKKKHTVTGMQVQSESPVNIKVITLNKNGEDIFAKGDFEGALDAFKKALDIDPNYATAHNNLGVLYWQAGEIQKAVEHFAKALEIDPNDRDTILNCGELFKSLEKIEDAKNIYSSYLQKNPEDEEIAHAFMEADFQALDCKSNNRIGITNFSLFTYSKNSHFSYFKNNELALYKKKINKDDCDLKVYQDLLIYTFILENIPKGSKILEIGGGNSRVLNSIRNDYECWNIDKLEGLGNGPTTVDLSGCRLIKAYMGEFSKEVPDNYFDFVFSISALEHVDDNEETFHNVCLDIDRVLKSGGLSLHALDVVIKKTDVWTNKLLPYMFNTFDTVNTFIPLRNMVIDSDLYYMSKRAYSRCWEPITKTPYEEFGKPVSYNILWEKPLKVHDGKRVSDRPNAKS